MGHDPPGGQRRSATGQLPARRLGQRARGPHRDRTHPYAADASSYPLRAWHRGAGGEPAPDVSAASARVIDGRTDVGLEDYAREIVGSGFPAARGLSEAARGDFLDGYIQRIVERDFDELGRVIRRPATLLRWMNAYAAATASTASLETIRDAATGGEGQKPAKTTTQPYREILQRLFIVDELPAWAPTRNRISRLAMPPKHHLADPALAAACSESASARCCRPSRWDRRRCATVRCSARCSSRW